MKKRTIRERLAKYWVRDGCWIIQLEPRANGYVALGAIDGKFKYAHRLSYEQHYGAIPEGLEIDHICRNRACINPDHLQAVTHQKNKELQVVRRTHCTNGHDLSIYRNSNGLCRLCWNAYHRKYRRRERASTCAA